MGLASMESVVITGADVDADGVPDEMDECPQEAGPSASRGCQLPGDIDADGLVGEQDACPETAGSPEASGCPIGMAPDGDLDGAHDTSDRCPDEAGLPDWDGCPLAAWSINHDGDELPDFLDDCPEDYGARDTGGCPTAAGDDRDGDGVADGTDAYPDLAGSPEYGGCPLESDRDGDGVADEADSCPDETGTPAEGGCPSTDMTNDADMDGVPDAFDACPDQAGPLVNSGCPLADDRDGDGVADTDDNCADIAGSIDSAGCPMLAFPAREYAMQNHLFPELVSRFGKDPTFVPPDEVETDGRGAGGTNAKPDDWDGDGVLDDTDACDEEMGRPMNAGCPLENDRDSDRVPDDRDPCPDIFGLSPGGCPRAGEKVYLAVDILSLETNPGWKGVYCYGWTNGLYNYYRIPYWDYRESNEGYVGYAPRFTDETAYVSVDLHCYGQPYDLGMYSQYLGHLRGDYHFFFWDGQTRKARAYGPGGWFEIWFRFRRLSYAET